MGGQFQERSTASHDMPSSNYLVETTDTAMSRWLQSAGLQHLASPISPPPPSETRFLLAQDYARHGMHSIEEKQKLFKLIKAISTGLDPSLEPRAPLGHNIAKNNTIDGFSSPERRGELGAGILDLHSMDDMEILSEDVMPEPFEASPFVTVTEKGYVVDALWSSNKPQSGRQRLNDSSPIRAAIIEEHNSRESNLARIKVVVRKRPLNKKEITRKEEDIVTIDAQGSSLTVHEPKLKVDLTAYVEKHDFVFDAVLDEHVTNDEVYKVTVEPIIPMIFQRTKATCFAYGQTGSGKTYTMQPLPLRACHDILNMMDQPSFHNRGLQLWFSFFEIYGGKLYDLLNDRRKLCMREDGRQQVCIVGLKEFPVPNVQLVSDYIEQGNSARSTGSTGANEESSRSHAILQLVIKKHSQGKDGKGGKMVGKFSFIDLAGSERGADTTDNDRQTRIEGAEINKSLLALKECIRALDHEQGHIPFRGSKLTEVLRDSFVGDSRTVMISCISPNTGCCEHTLNTLRYADRVKGLSRNSNSKRDPNPGTITTISLQRELASSPPLVVLPEPSLAYHDYKAVEGRNLTMEQARYAECGDSEGQLSLSSNQSVLTREDTKATSISDLSSMNPGAKGLSNSEQSSNLHLVDNSELEKVSIPQHKTYRDEKLEKHVNSILTEEAKSNTSKKRQEYREDLGGQSSFRDLTEVPTVHTGYNSHIIAILEEEEDLIAAHRLEIEDSMELVSEEMKLLTEVDQPGSQIDNYVSQLSYILSRKAAGIVNLQARLARFQRHLKEQDILSNTASFK